MLERHSTVQQAGRGWNCMAGYGMIIHPLLYTSPPRNLSQLNYRHLRSVPGHIPLAIHPTDISIQPHIHHPLFDPHPNYCKSPKTLLFFNPPLLSLFPFLFIGPAFLGAFFFDFSILLCYGKKIYHSSQARQGKVKAGRLGNNHHKETQGSKKEMKASSRLV